LTQASWPALKPWQNTERMKAHMARCSEILGITGELDEETEVRMLIKYVNPLSFKRSF
jgi:hypothetical protein